jgi:hypothetical protein
LSVKVHVVSFIWNAACLTVFAQSGVAPAQSASAAVMQMIERIGFLPVVATPLTGPNSRSESDV